MLGNNWRFFPMEQVNFKVRTNVYFCTYNKMWLGAQLLGLSLWNHELRPEYPDRVVVGVHMNEIYIIRIQRFLRKRWWMLGSQRTAGNATYDQPSPFLVRRFSTLTI